VKALLPLDPWEAAWSPYDNRTYGAVLEAIGPDDVVLEIGAGDLRLAVLLARRAVHVEAWEIRPELLPEPASLPPNLKVLIADARCSEVPVGTTVAVLLMRHCTHYGHYVALLRAAGCRRLITNARWRAGVEVIDLGPAHSWPPPAGWWGCRRCGATGFLAPGPDAIDDVVIARETDVEGCPRCPAAAREGGGGPA
jgi:hypothetical protein